MDFTDEELQTLFGSTGYASEHNDKMIIIRTRILNELEKRKELAELDFECSSCKL